jgi:hypothetical protein
MDEEKKSEASEGEVEQVGPYQLHEQVVQDEHSRGELYRASHETSGATALVLKPSAEDGAAPLPDWQVRCISSGSPGYFALEVEQSNWAVAPDKYSAEALMCLFEEVRDGVNRMAQAFPESHEPRLPWRLGLALAGAVVVGTLVFALLRPAPVGPPPEGPAPWASATPTLRSYEVPADTVIPLTGHSMLLSAADGGLPVLAHPFPSKPYPGQKRPPCKPRVEVEIMGACWVPHKLKAPCPEDLYEYKGECYTTSMLPPKQPQSLEQ